MDLDPNAGYIDDDSSEGDWAENTGRYEEDKPWSDEEAFEREVRSYLDPGRGAQRSGEGVSSGASGDQKELKVEFYDDVYFSSGDEETNAEGVQSRVKHKKLTNDELFYDPEMDDRDQAWVTKQRERNRPRPKEEPKKEESREGSEEPKKAPKTPKAPPTSDAILNCPCCMSILSLDCQRHDIYVNQYRAMFVKNCTVVDSETLKYLEPPSAPPRKGKRVKLGKAAREEGQLLEYHPVRCTICNTEVGVYDADEVYHFFNVLASEP